MYIMCVCVLPCAHVHIWSTHQKSCKPQTYIRYSSKVTSHSLDILEGMSRACRARVEQTYLSTLTAHRSRNRSDNRELRHRIQLCRQILSASVISSFESSISCTCSDTRHNTRDETNSHNS